MSDTCHHCGAELLAAARGRPKRYCSAACRLLAFRKGAEACNEKPGTVADPCNEIEPDLASDNFVSADSGLCSARTDDPARGSTPGALQGDDYPLEYYEDGYPKLPACLDRRVRPEIEEKAA